MRTSFRAERTALSVLLAATALLVTAPHALTAQDSTAVEKPTADYITREQLTTVKSNNLYELIESIHNNWLRERLQSPSDRAATKVDTGRAQYTNDFSASGKSFPGQNGGIQVYVDGTRVGGLDVLKSIRTADLWSVRRINGIDAQARFGIGHGAGVLYVVTLPSRGRNP